MTYHIPLLDEIPQMFENEVVRYNVVGHLSSVYIKIPPDSKIC